MNGIIELDKQIYLVKNLIDMTLNQDEKTEFKNTNDQHYLTLDRVNKPYYGFFIRVEYSSTQIFAHIVDQVPLDQNLNPLTTANHNNCLYVFISGDGTLSENEQSTLSFMSGQTPFLSKKISCYENHRWLYADGKETTVIDLNKTIRPNFFPILKNERIFTVKMPNPNDLSHTTGDTYIFNPQAEISTWFATHERMPFSTLQKGQMSFSYSDKKDSQHFPYKHHINNKDDILATYYLALPESEIVVDGTFNFYSLNAQINKISDTSLFIICCTSQPILEKKPTKKSPLAFGNIPE